MEHKKFQNKVLIIYSNFYSEISDNLLDGATKFLKKENISYETLCVPGSLEIPFFLKKNREKFSGYIILGCIIKGETDHYDVVKKSTFNYIYKFSYDYCFPLSTALHFCISSKLSCVYFIPCPYPTCHSQFHSTSNRFFQIVCRS